MREKLIPAEIKCNPCRPTKLGGAKPRRTKSNYKATAVTPRQVFTILSLVPILERTMILLVAATAPRVLECCGLKWHDINWERQKLHVRRRWCKGAVDIPKTKASATFVAYGQDNHQGTTSRTVQVQLVSAAVHQLALHRASPFAHLRTSEQGMRG